MDNITDLLLELPASERMAILDLTHDYVRLELSVFNVGHVIRSTVTNDLPDDYDDQVSTGRVAFLEIDEAARLLSEGAL